MARGWTLSSEPEAGPRHEPSVLPDDRQNEPEPDSAAAGSGRFAVLRRIRRRLDFTGTAMAVLLLCLSLTPSLLPRPWFLQGLVSGVLTAFGYLLGVGLAMIGHWLARWHPGPRPRRIAWAALWVLTAVLVPAFLVLSAVWQRQVTALMGVRPPSPLEYAAMPPEAVAIFLTLVVVVRTLLAAMWAAVTFVTRRIPRRALRLLAGAVVAYLTFALLQGLVANGLVTVANAGFRARNEPVGSGVSRPVHTELSGGPGSLVPWRSLGRYGSSFVAAGPTTAQLSAFSGRPAVQPIRVYVGVRSAGTLRTRAALAVRELQRTGAFDRKVLCVITTTGMGWVDRDYVDPLEYMYDGDTAQVAIQYSYLPSVLSFVVDRDRAKAAGRELFDQVYAAWSRLPEGHRPRLLVFGESLGAFGAESAFSGADDIRNRTGGMLLVGPPNSSPLWSRYVAARDPGTSEWLPTYQHGDTVRFAGRPQDLRSPGTPWRTPRVVYLQHPSDPVVWWSPRLILRRPDWLREPRGRDVDGSVRWYPVVTFAQLTADLVLAIKAPPGHGHAYDGEAVDAWAQIAPPAGWNASRTAALNDLINNRN